jgi:hypothetical protein
MRHLPEAFAFFLLAGPAAYYFTHVEGSVQRQLAHAAGFSLLAFFATVWLIPIISNYLLRRGLKGRDMGRRGTPQEAVEVCVGPPPRRRYAALPAAARPAPNAPSLPLPSPPPAVPPRWASSLASCF